MVRHLCLTSVTLRLISIRDFPLEITFYPSAQIGSFEDKINQGYDLVIGSRYVRGGGSTQTLDRKVFSWSANTLTRVLLGLHAHDTTAGFRCYRRQALESLDLDSITSSGYSFLFEMLFRVEQRGCKVGEVPIIFEDRRMGASKISRNEIVKALRTMLRLAPRRLAKKSGRTGP